MDLEKRLSEKLKYLYDMAKKYSDLNSKTKSRYSWRENAIYNQIESLEELKNNISDNAWDECYTEDLKESQGF